MTYKEFKTKATALIEMVSEEDDETIGHALTYRIVFLVVDYLGLGGTG